MDELRRMHFPSYPKCSIKDISLARSLAVLCMGVLGVHQKSQNGEVTAKDAAPEIEMRNTKRLLSTFPSVHQPYCHVVEQSMSILSVLHHCPQRYS